MNVLQYINHFAVMNDVSFHLLDLFFLLFFIFLDLLFFSKLLLLLPPNVYCLAKELGGELYKSKMACSEAVLRFAGSMGDKRQIKSTLLQFHYYNLILDEF